MRKLKAKKPKAFWQASRTRAGRKISDSVRYVTSKGKKGRVEFALCANSKPKSRRLFGRQAGRLSFQSRLRLN
jgi:hypothetical protein